jgi:hypothetical protein
MIQRMRNSMINAGRSYMRAQRSYATISTGGQLFAQSCFDSVTTTSQMRPTAPRIPPNATRTVTGAFSMLQNS